MDYNYHTHTARCSHAYGQDEEYVKSAIAGGIKYMGFSDHVPFIFPDGYESDYRVPVSKAKEYISGILELKEKYKNEITLNVGFEMEYYSAYFVDMFKSAVRFGAEYLILGQHYLHQEHPHGVAVSKETTSIIDLNEYVSTLIFAIKSGVFTYVAHPDMIKFMGDITIYKDAMRKICKASREYNVPLELNFLGIREGRLYPRDIFWEVAGEEKSPVTFGLDAHRSCDAADRESLEKAKQIVQKFNLNYIGKPELKKIQDIQF